MTSKRAQRTEIFSQSFFFGTFLLTAVLGGMFLGRSNKAYAIPSYARQLGVDCDQCHTVWPRLNAFGRRFKVKGYVDQSANPGFPLAARILVNAQSVNTTSPGQPPSTSGVINFPSAVNLFIGKRLTPQVGVFSAFTVTPQTNLGGGRNWVTSVDEQKYAYNFLTGKAVSLVAFHSTIFGFDPFPSLGNLAFEGDYSLAPGILSNGELLSPFDTTGFGLAVHGFLDKRDHYYGGIGLETGGALPDTLGLGIGQNDTSHDALDYVARFAYTGNIGDSGGTFNIGGAYYAGGQIPTLLLANGSQFRYRGFVNRYFLDGALELPVGDNDLFELVGVYGTGNDRNYFTADPVAGVDGPKSAAVNGGFLQTDYTWNRKIGVRATWDRSTLGGVTTAQWQIGPVYLPVHDFKVNANVGPKSDSLGNRSFTYQLILTKMF